MHEADEPDAVIDFLDSEFLTGQYDGDVDWPALTAVWVSPQAIALFAQCRIARSNSSRWVLLGSAARYTPAWIINQLKPSWDASLK